MKHQFVVFKNARNRDAFPYVLVVQHELLSALPTRLAIPLARRKSAQTLGVPRLNPMVELAGAEYVLMTHLLGAVDLERLEARVGDLSDRRSEIIAAIDVLLSGV